jgi:SAM-dependent methyltransferase
MDGRAEGHAARSICSTLMTSEIPTHWWQSFFRGPWERVQLAGYPDDLTGPEVTSIVQALQLEPGARVLDVPCGEGRHSVELAQRGFVPIGVDFNPIALAAGRKRAADKGVSVTFVEGDARTFTLDEPCDAAICFFGSFGYFSDDDNLRFARRIAEALRPGGQFLLDLQIIETVLPDFRARDWWWVTPEQKMLVAEHRRFDPHTSRVEGTFTFIGDGYNETAAFSIRLYTLRELEQLLRAAGFVQFRALEAGTGEPFAFGSERLTLVAQTER